MRRPSGCGHGISITVMGRSLSYQFNSQTMYLLKSVSVCTLQNVKSVNLQYNTLVRWVNWTNDSLTKRLMFLSIIFFSWNLANFIFSFFYEITKMKIKSFECPKSIGNYKKNTWNLSRLVNKLFVPSARQTSVLYCRLLDLWSFGIRHLDGNCPPIFEIFTTFTQPAQSSVELSD